MGKFGCFHFHLAGLDPIQKRIGFLGQCQQNLADIEDLIPDDLEGARSAAFSIHQLADVGREPIEQVEIGVQP